MTGHFGIGAFVVLAGFGAGIGLFSPRVATNQSPAPFTDMSGHSADIATPPRNTAVLAPVLSPYAAIAGNLKSVRAVSKYIRVRENNGALHLVFPELTELPLLSRSGAVPDPEMVLRFAPDAVLVWHNQSDALRAIGYPGLVALEWDGNDHDGKRLWKLFGRLLNEEMRAAYLWQEAESQQQALRAQLPHVKPIKVLFMSPYERASAWIGGKRYFLNALLQGLGAENLTGDLGIGGFVGAEQILHYEPDVILVPSFRVEDALSEIYRNPVWHALSAVRERRVYLMPYASAFNIPVEQTPLLFWLAEVLYPGLPHMTRDAYRAVYADIYDRSLSDGAIDTVLHMQKNANTSGYARFRATP